MGSPYQRSGTDTAQPGMGKLKLKKSLEKSQKIPCFETTDFLTGLEALLMSDTGVEKLKRGVNHSELGVHSKGRAKCSLKRFCKANRLLPPARKKTFHLPVKNFPTGNKKYE